MNELTLTIWCDGQTQTVPLQGSRLTIGRGDNADISVSDQSLSRIHASINRDANHVWVLDEGSTNGTFVNGKSVSASGVQLKDGDQITLGLGTKITISQTRQQASQVTAPPQAVAQSANGAAKQNGASILAIAGAALVVVTILSAATVFAWKYAGERKIVVANETPTPFVEATSTPSATASVVPSPAVTLISAPPTNQTPNPSVADNTTLDDKSNVTLKSVALTELKASELKNEQISLGTKKLYKQLSEREQVFYVYKKAKEIGKKVGNREAEFPDEAITIIKYWLDAYSHRIGSGSTRLWAEDLNFMFLRARTTFVPTIIRAFKANNAPPVVGLYLPVIETEYRNITTENFAGAAGLFQFIGPTARGYGVDPSERTNIEKMAPAAARYINDRLAEFGPDAIGVGLSIAGYNRSPDSVRRDLHDVIDSQNKDRDFWILVKNKAKLDAWFQKENINYPPRFFAAAIIGENPWDFAIKMRRPLSTYSEVPKSIDE